MGMQEIDIKATLPGDPAAVWRLLSDSSSWPSWTPIETHEQERAAGPDGTGEIRLFRTGRYKIREQIAEFVPERRYTYILLSGLALKEYRAEIDLEPTGDGRTRLRWHTTFKPKGGLFGGVYRSALEKRTQEFVDGLAAAVTPQLRST